MTGEFFAENTTQSLQDIKGFEQSDFSFRFLYKGYKGKVNKYLTLKLK